MNEAVALFELAIKLVKLIVDKQEDPQAYLQGLIDGLEKDAQALAKDKYG